MKKFAFAIVGVFLGMFLASGLGLSTLRAEEKAGEAAKKAGEAATEHAGHAAEHAGAPAEHAGAPAEHAGAPAEHAGNAVKEEKKTETAAADVKKEEVKKDATKEAPKAQ